MRGKGVFVKQDRGSAGEQHRQDSTMNCLSVYFFATISAFTVFEVRYKLHFRGLTTIINCKLCSSAAELNYSLYFK